MNKLIILIIAVIIIAVGSGSFSVFQKPAFPEPNFSAEEIPFGLSNPYDQKDTEAGNALPAILKDLGLSKDANGAGFVVDIIGRKQAEVKCGKFTCQQYDFSQAKELIDLVVGQGKTHVWIVIGPPSNYKFIDGKERKDKKTYLPDGSVSRQAYKDYLTALVNFVNSYGRKVSVNPDWYVVRWNLYNEVNAEYKDTFDKDSDKAATAYVNFVIDSAEILRNLYSQSKIVLAGAGSFTDLEGKHGEFYRLVFSKLKQSKLAYEPFDYWESHWFGEFNNYAKNEAGYEAKDFINFLKNNGYGDKEFLIRAGATYSGKDIQERKHLMDNYQSEQQQAEFLAKRFIYNLANNTQKIPWSTVYEHRKYQGEFNVHFNYIGLIYNGIPDGKSRKQKCSEGWLPCPDPGKGIKKLSYYAFKKLIEILKGSDWSNIRAIKTEVDNVYLYKFIKNGNPTYVAWWDYWKEEQDSKTIILDIGDFKSVKITEAIPNTESGADLDENDYPSFFKIESKAIANGKVIVVLKKIPVFVEGK